jgi:hypothetical protein
VVVVVLVVVGAVVRTAVDGVEIDVLSAVADLMWS